MSRTNTARTLLILGLSFVFLYFGIDKFANSLLWIGWIPPWMDGLFGLPSSLWLSVIGSIEMILGLALLTPVKILRQAASILMALHLIGILTQVGWNDVGARDIGLLFMSISVWFLL